MSHVCCYSFMCGIIPLELRATVDSHLYTPAESSAPTGSFVHDPNEIPHSFLREKKVPLIVLLEFYDCIFLRNKKKMILIFMN